MINLLALENLENNGPLDEWNVFARVINLKIELS